MKNYGADLSEDEKAVRQAEIRAAIQGWLNNNPGMHTVSQIAKGIQENIERLNYSSQSLYSILPTMVKAGTVKLTEEDSKHYYYHPRWEGDAIDIDASAPSVKRIKRSSNKQSQMEVQPQASITIDVVKETGRVRITTQGLTIEIGIVEK